ESASYDIKTLREDRHASEENFVAEATRRRRRSSRASFFFVLGRFFYGKNILHGLTVRLRK
ncbi:hypothetical protein RFY10_03415, partial [Acinetobacter baumannii]|nr:hypothetical protein [Acinetobacter baumannii]